MNNDKTPVYDKLELIRQASGLNKKDMAQRLGINPRQYSIWAIKDAPKRYLLTAKAFNKEADNICLMAIYESKREQIITSYRLSHQINQHFQHFQNDLGESCSLPYSIACCSLPYYIAYCYKICPLFELKFQNPKTPFLKIIEEDPFRTVYKIKGDLVYNVYKHCRPFFKSTKIKFKDLEDHFNEDADQETLKKIISYFLFAGELDQIFFEGLLADTDSLLWQLCSPPRVLGDTIPCPGLPYQRYLK